MENLIVLVLCCGLFTSCNITPEFPDVSACVTLYQTYAASFQAAAVTLMEHCEAGFSIVRQAEAPKNKTEYQVHELYMQSAQPLEASSYETIYRSVEPLLQQAQIVCIGVGENGIGFILSYVYGTEAAIYYMYEGELPESGLQSIVERERIDDSWVVMIQQD